MNTKRTVVVGAVLLIVAAFAVHYALYGSLPLGKPTFLDRSGAADDSDA